MGDFCTLMVTNGIKTLIWIWASKSWITAETPSTTEPPNLEFGLIKWIDFIGILGILWISHTFNFFFGTRQTCCGVTKQTCVFVLCDWTYLMRWGFINSVLTDPRISLLLYSTRLSSPALKIIHTCKSKAQQHAGKYIDEDTRHDWTCIPL